MICRFQVVYELWFHIFNDSLVPVLLAAHQPKWFSADKDLVPGDVVYFRKTEGSAIKGPWIMGLVDSTTKGHALAIRKVCVKYFNAGEDFPQFTERAIRSLVKLFNVDEVPWQTDLDTVRKICESTGLSLVEPDIRTFATRAQVLHMYILPWCYCDLRGQLCTKFAQNSMGCKNNFAVYGNILVTFVLPVHILSNHPWCLM